jgi:choline kinase
MKKLGADLTIILPCAGNGRRMKSHGPKSLIQIEGEITVIQKQLKILLGQFPKAEVIVIVGFQADKLIKHLPKNVKIVENEFFEDTSSVRSLALALRVASNTRLLIINGDIIFNNNTIKNLVGNESIVVVDSHNQIAKDKVGVNVIDSYAAHFAYGFQKKWAQIAYITNGEFPIFYNMCCDKDRKRVFIFEIFNNMIDKGAKLKCFEPKTMKVIEIDSFKDIQIAKGI